MIATVSSFGALTASVPPRPGLSTVSLQGGFYDGHRRTYKRIYEAQPEVLTAIDFFARNIAQLGLHVFQMVSDTDRVRLRTHRLAQTIRRPNPSTTRYRLIETTVQDYLTYANACWLRVRLPGRETLGLVRLPAEVVTVTGRLLPTAYRWTPAGGQPLPRWAPAEIVHFRMGEVIGHPPLETLRRQHRTDWTILRSPAARHSCPAGRRPAPATAPIVHFCVRGSTGKWQERGWRRRTRCRVGPRRAAGGPTSGASCGRAHLSVAQHEVRTVALRLAGRPDRARAALRLGSGGPGHCRGARNDPEGLEGSKGCTRGTPGCRGQNSRA